MKKTIIAIAFLLAASVTGFAQDKKKNIQNTHRHTTTKYTCPMHPEVVRSKPGKCPKCGMTLVAVKKQKVQAKKNNS